MYYSPFVDGNGDFVLLNELTYAHLSQLLEIEEGYKVEFKSRWNDDVKKKHLAKTISSFANTTGGWLFIGVNNDGSITPIDNQRTDFGQQVSEIIKSTISPYPAFETKFIHCPNDDSRVVLVIYIREGREPPYICNGTVYIRVGSSKEPIISSHRSEIDNLISKRDNYLKEFEKFCVDNVIKNDDFPYCVVYLYNKQPSKRMNFGCKTTLDEIQSIADKYSAKTWMPSATSILFYNSADVSTSAVTNIFEIFSDYSMKFHIPLSIVPNDLSATISQELRQRNPKLDINGFKAVDGYLSYVCIRSLFDTAFSILNEKDILFSDYIVKADLKNINNSYLFFATQNNEWFDFASKRNFRYSPKDSISPFFSNSIDINSDDLESKGGVYTFLCLSFSFGYLINEFFEFIDLNDKLANINFPEGKYTNHEYYYRVFGIRY